jgi:hypothetical protein
MASVRESVFQSNAEKKLFEALRNSWASRVDIFHNLPLLNIIDVDLRAFSFEQASLIKNTSVDYTACDLVGRPLVSVEFDGMGDGFSDRSGYVQRRETPDPLRKIKLDLKADLFADAGYSFFVVGYDEADPIPGAGGLTIVHAMIGTCLSRMDKPARRRAIESRWPRESPPKSKWDEYNLEEQAEHQAEWEADHEWNPVARLRDDAFDELFETGEKFEVRLEGPPAHQENTVLVRATLFHDAGEINRFLSLRDMTHFLGIETAQTLAEYFVAVEFLRQIGERPRSV